MVITSISHEPSQHAYPERPAALKTVEASREEPTDGLVDDPSPLQVARPGQRSKLYRDPRDGCRPR